MTKTTRGVASSSPYSDPKGRAIVFWYGISSRLRRRTGVSARVLYLIIGGLYKFITEWILGVELPASTRVGSGLVIHHGTGLVVNPNSIIGNNVVLRHAVTIGNRGTSDACPVIGDNVEIGAGAMILGPITIGHGASIGAMSLVLTDVPDGGRVRAEASRVSVQERGTPN